MSDFTQISFYKEAGGFYYRGSSMDRWKWTIEDFYSIHLNLKVPDRQRPTGWFAVYDGHGGTFGE